MVRPRQRHASLLMAETLERRVRAEAMRAGVPREVVEKDYARHTSEDFPLDASTPHGVTIRRHILTSADVM